MITKILLNTVALLAVSVAAAEPNLKEQLKTATEKLSQQPNYSWKTTVVVPENSRFRPGPVEGKTEKDGLTIVTMTFGENRVQAVLQGEKAAVTNPDGGWQSISELDAAEGPRRFVGMIVRNIKTPSAQAAELASFAKDLKKEGEAYSSDLAVDGVKTLLSFGRRGGNGPEVSNPKGSVKFWLKDGLISKYEFKVKGTVNFNGNDVEVDRDTTVEIKDIGTTKVEAPEEAKKKLT